MNKPISDYAIGDDLYRYIEIGGVFRYIVTGRREYEGETQLEVESQSCSHGWKCKILVAQNDYGRIVSVHMLNNDDEDDQRHWHSQDDMHFWPTSREAKKERLRKLVRDAKEKVSQAEEALKNRRKSLADLEEALSLVDEPAQQEPA